MRLSESEREALDTALDPLGDPHGEFLADRIYDAVEAILAARTAPPAPGAQAAGVEAVREALDAMYERLAVPTFIREELERSLVEIGSAWFTARLGEALAEHRREWAGWLEGWLGAVGPEPPTVEAVIEWLRAESLPFGRATNPDAGEQS